MDAGKLSEFKLDFPITTPVIKKTVSDEQQQEHRGKDGVTNAQKTDLKIITPQSFISPQNEGFNRKEFLASLPNDGVWKKGEAPANRLQNLRTEFGTLKNHVLIALHKDNISEKDQMEVMERVGAFRQAVDETTTNFPEPGGVNIETFMMSAKTYNQGENGIKATHIGLKKSLQNLDDTVRISLETPGSSKNETVKGFFRKKPLDDVVNDLFKDTENKLTIMYNEASRINKEGNTIVNEGDLGLLSPEIRTTRKEGEAPSVSDYIPGGAVGAKIIIDTLGSIFGK